MVIAMVEDDRLNGILVIEFLGFTIDEDKRATRFDLIDRSEGDVCAFNLADGVELSVVGFEGQVDGIAHGVESTGLNIHLEARLDVARGIAYLFYEETTAAAGSVSIPSDNLVVVAGSMEVVLAVALEVASSKC